MTNWEYRIVSLATVQAPKPEPGESAAVTLLNDEGLQGWEAIGLTNLEHGECAVLMKRPLAKSRSAGGRM